MKLTTLSTLILALGLAGCAGGWQILPASNETGDETGAAIESPIGASADMRTLSVNQTTNIRKMVSGVLELAVELPVRSVIQIPNNPTIVNPDFRNSDGSIDRSSTGFVGGIKIVSAPDGVLTKAKIDSLNKTLGGLYVSASMATAVDGATGSYKAVVGATPGADFKGLFETSGKPKFTFTSSVTKRFGPRLNKPVNPSSLSANDLNKYKKIFAELQKFANRKVETPKAYLMIDKESATYYSKAYENSGIVASNGAWSIAVGVTAVRHGFDNVPCAEFMSETVREAYQRAGYAVSADFNAAKGNQLIWSRTNAVVNFSKSLYDAGWVPYEPSKFRPPVGALLMNASGNTPGHTYIAAGEDGRLIVDNGSPQGRDLRTTSKKILEMMYETGVFFLPPGITPQAW